MKTIKDAVKEAKELKKEIQQYSEMLVQDGYNKCILEYLRQAESKYNELWAKYEKDFKNLKK